MKFAIHPLCFLAGAATATILPHPWQWVMIVGLAVPTGALWYRCREGER